MLFLKSEIVVVTIAVYFAAKVRTIFCTTKEIKIKTDGLYSDKMGKIRTGQVQTYWGEPGG